MQKIEEYFMKGIVSETLRTIGAEVETQFVYGNGRAVETRTSQQMLKWLSENGWKIESRKGSLITALIDSEGNKIFYELGRHNIEIATIPSTPDKIISVLQNCLNQLYEAANKFGAFPYFVPILPTDEDLLIIPDERDAIWLELDGREALALLARISSVQFTVSVAPEDAVQILNMLGRSIELFMSDFPQDEIWKKYITDSSAEYLSDRYGGPLTFDSLEEYCQELIKHDVVQGNCLTPFESVGDLDTSLFLRSIWWHFRLKRYNNDLCIEVRPLPRRRDEDLQNQLEKVLSIIRI